MINQNCKEEYLKKKKKKPKTADPSLKWASKKATLSSSSPPTPSSSLWCASRHVPLAILQSQFSFWKSLYIYIYKNCGEESKILPQTGCSSGPCSSCSRWSSSGLLCGCCSRTASFWASMSNPSVLFNSAGRWRDSPG
jgi:hypothetical protein